MFAGLIVTQPVYANESDEPTISVSGAGAVTMEPEIATLSLGVNVQDEDPAQAVTRNNAMMQAVIEAVRAQGVAEEDIVTTDFSIRQVTANVSNFPIVRPVLDHEAAVEWPTTYEVSNNVSLTVRDIDRVGDVLGAATAAGANVSGGIRFDVVDSSAAYNEALALAVQNAGGKAETISRALGMNISGLVSLSEQSGWDMPVARAFAEFDGIAAAPAGGFDVPVQAAELTITARVHAVFALSR